jgi:hypothetical protein
MRGVAGVHVAQRVPRFLKVAALERGPSFDDAAVELLSRGRV